MACQRTSSATPPPGPAPKPVATTPAPTLAAWPAPGFQRGVMFSSWDGSYPHKAACQQALDQFKALGIQWVQVVTFAEQPDLSKPSLERTPDHKWPAQFVNMAHEQGFRVLLKPHVWSRQFYDGSKRWRGTMQMPDDASYDAWFKAYRAFILFEARQATKYGVEMLSVGLEYVEITRTQGARWRALIKEVRAVYPGLLTYAADGNHEAAHVDFWDALDVIGVNAYFKVAEQPGDAATAEALKAGWAPYLKGMHDLSTRWKRPIVFTEAGYPSSTTGPVQPWQWPKAEDTPDLALQARAYDALLAACTGAPWCQGVYWWKWYEVPEQHVPHNVNYSPRGKPAAQVLAKWFKQTQQPDPSEATGP